MEERAVFSENSGSLPASADSIEVEAATGSLGGGSVSGSGGPNRLPTSCDNVVNVNSSVFRTEEEHVFRIDLVGDEMTVRPLAR